MSDKKLTVAESIGPGWIADRVRELEAEVERLNEENNKLRADKAGLVETLGKLTFIEESDPMVAEWLEYELTEAHAALAKHKEQP